MYTVFTPGGKDIVGITRKPQIIAVFDSLCNGVILDENGITRFVSRKKRIENKKKSRKTEKIKI